MKIFVSWPIDEIKSYNQKYCVIYDYGQITGSIRQLIMFLVVKPAHLDLTPRLDADVRIFLDLF
jgi:hypothetical protein